MEQAKVEEIKKLRDQQIVLLKKGIRIAKYPEPKRPSTAIKRAFRIIGIVMHCAVIQNQKRTIAAQVPFKKGGIIVEPKRFKCMSCEKDIPENEQLIFCSECIK